MKVMYRMSVILNERAGAREVKDPVDSCVILRSEATKDLVDESGDSSA